MKQFVTMAVFILSLPLVFSFYGGETWTYHFDKCDTLRVNITATDEIIDGEYIILNNCTKNHNYYACYCNDDYNFSVLFKANAVNKYTFDFNYDYSVIVQEHESNSGGGGGGGKKTKCEPNWNCTAWTICEPNSKMTRNCSDLNGCNEERPFEQRACYFNIPKEEQPKIDEPVKEPIDSQIEVGNISVGVFNDTAPDALAPPKANYMVLFILLGLFIVLSITLVVVYFLQK